MVSFWPYGLTQPSSPSFLPFPPPLKNLMESDPLHPNVWRDTTTLSFHDEMNTICRRTQALLAEAQALQERLREIEDELCLLNWNEDKEEFIAQLFDRLTDILGMGPPGGLRDRLYAKLLAGISRRPEFEYDKESKRGTYYFYWKDSCYTVCIDNGCVMECDKTYGEYDSVYAWEDSELLDDRILLPGIMNAAHEGLVHLLDVEDGYMFYRMKNTTTKNE